MLAVTVMLNPLCSVSIVCRVQGNKKDGHSTGCCVVVVPLLQ